MHWNIKPKAPEDFLKKFSEFSPLVIQLLYNRGLKTQEQIDEFFDSIYGPDVHDPFLMNDMDKAVDRVLKAVKKKEKIAIYGDYDADGVCSSAILFFVLQCLGVSNIRIYIPDRKEESHGLNKKAIKKLADEGINLIITVDCASNNLAEIELANSLNLEVIVTDHHELEEEFPKAVALINPYHNDNRYPFQDLAGAGVAYKLGLALLSSKKSKYGEELKKQLLDLVAIATIADVMPLIGENRILVKRGLKVLTETRWLGLKKLMELARIEILPDGINSYAIGYFLAPRINVAGRLNHANKAFELLTTEDEDEALRLAQELEADNVIRQKSTEVIVQELEKRIQAKKGIPKLFLEGDAEWSVGLLGLAAGKIAERYSRPTIIYQERDGFIFASSRSIPSFDLFDALKQCDNLLEKFGGHKAAAGFTAKKENLEKIRKKLTAIAEEKLTAEDLIPTLNIEAELPLAEMNLQNYEKIQKFAPFGKGNLMPKLLARGLEIVELREVGNSGKHLKLLLRMFNGDAKLAKNFKAIGFNLSAEWRGKLKVGSLIDVVFEMGVNEWMGYRDLEMKINDIKIQNL